MSGSVFGRLQCRNFVNNTRKAYRFVDVLFLQPHDAYVPGNIATVDPSLMRHDYYPNKIAVYVTQENLELFRRSRPGTEIKIIFDEEKALAEGNADAVSQFMYAPNPFDRASAKALGISKAIMQQLSQETASQVESTTTTTTQESSSPPS